MSSSLHCWIHGHSWRPRKHKPQRITEDLFGNLWRLRRCSQCGAISKTLHKSWSER